jgi:uncharacterized protein (DUF305 family)
MRKSILAAVAAATLLLTAGCGINAIKDANPDAGSQHNEADITFAQMMIPHHEQAIEMANLAETRAESQEVKDLAAAIEAAQGPEIETMQGWLESWGAEGMSHDMSREEMPGMVDSKTMGDLGKASGAEFDRLFLTAMIAHHEGAIAMAESEKSDGVHKGSLRLADAIIKTQTAEIKRMRTLLTKGLH